MKYSIKILCGTKLYNSKIYEWKDNLSPQILKKNC